MRQEFSDRERRLQKAEAMLEIEAENLKRSESQRQKISEELALISHKLSEQSQKVAVLQSESAGAEARALKAEAMAGQLQEIRSALTRQNEEREREVQLLSERLHQLETLMMKDQGDKE